MKYSEFVQTICDHALLNALKIKRLRFQPMKRKNNRVNTKHGYIIGRTNLKTGLITIDIFTPKKRDPKKISSILRTLCHEAAHHQKKPFKQHFRNRWILRQHYPEFYQQVKKNIKKVKADKVLKKFFS